MSSSYVAAGCAVVLGVFAIGCSGESGKIALDTQGVQLTDAPNDKLFVVKLEDADEAGYAIDALRVKVKVDDADAVEVTCTAMDANANAKLEKGESMSCTEGATNLFGPSTVGKSAKVSLVTSTDGDEEVVGETDWKP